MLDLFDIAKYPKADIQIFTCGDLNNTNYSNYLVPRGKSMLFIYAVGGGGGGGGGFTGVASSTRGGGGGGGSGSISTLIVPIHLLPHKLFVRVNPGGVGGKVGVNNSGVGRPSVVHLAEATTIPTADILLTTSGGSGGGNGTSSAGGSSGGAGGATTAGNMPLAGIGLWSSFAGQAGVAGGTPAGGPAVASAIPVTGINVMGGAGGSGTTSSDRPASDITAITSSLLSESREQHGASALYGSSGHTLRKLFFNFPGMGGGSRDASAGGDGGNGAFGCGGGGGGAGTTGGRGGDGGSGLVIMIAW
jgi:hypothetical protein